MDLKDKGWVNYYSCNCGGTLKQYWKNKKYPGWEMIIRPLRNSVQIMKNSRQVGVNIYLYQLEQKLTDYAINT